MRFSLIPSHFHRFQISRFLFLLFRIMVLGSNFMKSNAIVQENNLKGWISTRGGCYASTTGDPYVSCTTFNILAPIYKRLDKENQSCRESEYRSYWLTRNQNILDRLLYERSSIICLQEFWVGNEELVDMYEKGLGDAGYMNFKLARTNNRGDAISILPLHQTIVLLGVSEGCESIQEVGLSFGLGLMTAVHKDYFRVLNYRELLFNDFGDRVAQLLHVESVVPFWQSRNSSTQNQVIIVNTHLLFPHNSSLSIIRLQQVYKILQYVESYQKEYNLAPMPVLLCGDWNGSKRGHVYKFLRSQGFVSSYDTAHQYTDSDADAHKWVSHRNHRGNICGVDFIWLLNPNKSQKPLKISWGEAVFGIIKYRLHEALLAENDAFALLKADSDGDYITYSGFCQALHQLELTLNSHGLSPEEMEELWIQADIDGNGIVDYEEFQKRIWDPSWSELLEDSDEEGDIRNDLDRTVGFDVKNAVLFPPEVEKGMWPENYSLSDHAPLTVVFSPRRMHCSQPIC